MARMTLRLPNTLHDDLTRRADTEGVSVNQFVVYALSRELALQSVEEQRAGFDALRSRLPKAEAEAALKHMLAERDS